MNPLEPPPGESPRPRVLIVDDHLTARRLARRIFEKEGYDVLEAADGQQALELALVEPVDLVLLDISMPVLDGFGLAAALHEDERTRDLPLVFVTGETSPLVKARAFDAGAKGYFEKPYDTSELSAFVARLLSDLVPQSMLPADR
jgi:CheY-like chemotaxis protein